MRVIFLKDLRNQGKKGEIKDVKDGYAQNFLIKNGYATKVTEQSLEKYEQEQIHLKELDQKKREEALKLKETLSKMTLDFKVKTGVGDKVFGSVSSKQIKESLEKNNIKIDKKQIKLQENIDTLGIHKVKIELYKDVIGQVNVHLVK